MAGWIDPPDTPLTHLRMTLNRLNLHFSGDKLVNLLLHYEATQTGIDAGDTRACLTAITTGGIPVYGCNTIVAKEPDLNQ